MYQLRLSPLTMRIIIVQPFIQLISNTTLHIAYPRDITKH